VSAQYFQPEQARTLVELYNADRERIATKTGTTLPVAPQPKLSERPFLPSLKSIPADILAAFHKRVEFDAVMQETLRSRSSAGLALARLQTARFTG
jgi:hypothetical protein